MTRLLGLSALAAVLALAAAPSHAVTTFGSAAQTRIRLCNSMSPSELCDGSGPGQVFGPSQVHGGIGVTSSVGFNLPNAISSGSVTFDSGGRPVWTGAVNAIGDVGLGSRGVGFNSYTNSGVTAVPLSAIATLAIANSSGSPNGNFLPLASFYFASVEIVDPSLLAGVTTATGILSAFNFGIGIPCGPGVLATGAIKGNLAGGAQSFTVGASSCSAGPLMVAPGQTVVVADGAFILGYRGGFVNGADLTLSGVPALAAVPEPAAWALMLVGFGGLGAVMRGSRRKHAGPIAA